tara:strand:- start:1517 stop:2089 length:573 start_codon:yes stop_codon:yes gene_type:complete
MILDETADLISSEGISNLTMEAIGQHANVSKSLMYNYFDSLADLLKELLDRELTALRRLQNNAAEKATTFEELVQNITHVYLSYIEERGLILERLQADPSITKMHDPTDYQRNSAVDYLAEIVAKNFDMPMDIARAVTDISFGLPASAGDYLLRSGMDRKVIEELTVSMIIGTMSSVRFDYMARKQKLKR